MRNKPIKTALPSTFSIGNKGVMFLFEKCIFDQCLRALFPMFPIFRGGTARWTKKEGGKMDDLDDPIRVMAAIIAAGLPVAGDGMEDGVVPQAVEIAYAISDAIRERRKERS